MTNKSIYNNRSVSCLFIVVFCLNFIQISIAQNATSSPYSRFGIGELSSITFARNLALGGSEIGLNQPGFINYGNPAAYSTLWYTTYEGGVDFKQSELKTSGALHKTHTASVAYFDFAFPVTPQKWSLGFGLLPYSKVGYSVSESNLNSFDDLETRTYTGSGGLNNFHIGTGFQVTKKLSFGVNAEYLFGVLNNDRTVSYRSPYYYNTSIEKSTSIGWFHFKTGFQYRIDSLRLMKSDSIIMLEKKIVSLQDSLSGLISAASSDSSGASYDLKNELTKEIANAELQKNSVVTRRVKSEWNLVLGLVASPAANLHARNSTLINSFRYYNYASPDLGLFVRDTILSTEGESGKVRLPFSTGFGFSLQKGTQWLFCADYTFQKWSDFSFLGASDSLTNSWKVTAGIQLTPNDRSVKSYLKIMQYRIGFHYEQTYLNMRGNNINDIGVSAGFGMPIRKAGTILHFTFEGGKRGTMADNLVQERYLKFTFGFTINDRWFIRPKYD